MRGIFTAIVLVAATPATAQTYCQNIGGATYCNNGYTIQQWGGGYSTDNRGNSALNLGGGATVIYPAQPQVQPYNPSVMPRYYSPAVRCDSFGRCQ